MGHQQNTVDFILKNVADGKRGFGDASNVGAGKTLSALSTISELYTYHRQKKVFALILLPTEKLYKTWRDEISKHFDQSIRILEQQANGSLKGKEIDGLNLVITTMGRNREHLLEKKWLFVVIDECLTVQNKEAQQTMSAWIQSIHSTYGVLLLSATFFRTRFDKLLYMLKMLNCNLPETKEYLDTILCDSIKVHLPASKREWKDTVLRYQLDTSKRKVYDSILESDLSNEMKYVRLHQFIREHIDYCNMFVNTIQKLEKGKKALIYAESKLEAEQFAKNIPDVGLYPDISKRHVVVSYANGTYGLNDLVGFNVLVTRPPEPDKLPQMKGRLDRPGQLSNQLEIIYILLENTIEEATYLRIDLCNKFYSNHIMPISEFYSLALK
ncbi:DEAD/DEAH box helicase [bacterium]|nr:DEAD/DEAH box helicase [bacterium]